MKSEVFEQFLLPYIEKFWREKLWRNEHLIHQYFTHTNSRFTKVSYFKFAKTLKRSIRQSLTPPKFCAIYDFIRVLKEQDFYEIRHKTGNIQI